MVGRFSGGQLDASLACGLPTLVRATAGQARESQAPNPEGVVATERMIDAKTHARTDVGALDAANDLSIPNAECHAHDFADFRVFRMRFNGPNRPPACIG